MPASWVSMPGVQSGSGRYFTLLSGRYVEIRMLPLSFKEFLDFYQFDARISIEERFAKYLQFGGMPVLNEKLYIQVTESMSSPENRERELRLLQMIRDNYEKNSFVNGQRLYPFI